MKNFSSKIASTFPENGKSEVAFFFSLLFFYSFWATETSEVGKLRKSNEPQKKYPHERNVNECKSGIAAYFAWRQMQIQPYSV